MNGMFTDRVKKVMQLAREDLHKWCSPLTDEQLNLSTAGNASVAFHLRHIARSLDRLLTYAEGRQLSESQLEVMRTEAQPDASVAECFAELDTALARSSERVFAFTSTSLEAPRSVGRKSLPTSVAGLLVHVADHTMRHVGQAITTAKFAAAQRTHS